MFRATLRRLFGRVRWIPAGGSNPLGALGHAAAAVELAGQLAREGAPPPDTIVVPLGSGGTAAGLLVGLAMTGLPSHLLGVRVVPRVVANRRRVLALARRAAALLGERSGTAPPDIDPARFTIEETQYGGAYARETHASRTSAALVLQRQGPALEGTYSAKALAAALAHAGATPHERVLYWLTFDGRWLDARAADRGAADVYRGAER
jgi:1-aminocyclopropane-1-carboxylate deaminase/D-cysteine desulfhydrase-like pyridoxal-dependent ACC family enzyme